ncbi:MAG: tetratricopeptide repeat protein [Treponema sp.]|nr:tetratricopeptide repeat protein [Treponema sp.]
MEIYNQDITFLVLDVDISRSDLGNIIHTAKKIIKNDKDKSEFAKAYLKIAQCFQKVGNFSWSKYPLDSALKIIPDYPEAIVRMGNIYCYEEKYEKALECFNKAIEIYQSNKNYKPDDLTYLYCMMAMTYDEIENFDNAIKYYSLSIKLKPDYALAYLNRGLSFLKKYSVINARNDYEKAIELKKEFVLAYDNLAFCLYVEGKYDEAILYCDKALEINSDYAPAYFTMGILLIEKNNYTMSLEYFFKHLQYAKKSDEYISTLYYIDKILFELNIEILWQYKDNKNIIKILRNHYNHFIKVFLFCVDNDLSENVFKNILNTVYDFWKSSFLAAKEIDIVYQYTTKDVLKQMFINKSLRLTPAQYQNDPEEGHTLYKHILNKDIDKILSKIIINIEDKNKTGEDTYDKRIAFIRSFTGKENDLMMWRLYGDDGEGVAIGVPTQVLSKGDGFFRNDAFYTMDLYPNKFKELKRMSIIKSGLFKVRYLSDNEFIIFFETIINHLEIICKKTDLLNKEDIYREFIELLFLPINHIIKNENHKNENEYRQIYISTINESKNIIANIDDPEIGVYIETEDILFGMHENYFEALNDYVDICFGPKTNFLTYIKIKDSFEHKYNKTDSNGNPILSIVTNLSKIPYQ